MRRLVLVGGGHAHVQVLHGLALQPLRASEVVLVTPYARQMYSGMVPGWVAGHYEVEDCVIPLAPLAARAGVRLIEAAAAGFDAQARRIVLSDSGEIGFDVASLDTGPVMDREAIPGAREHGLFVRPIELFTQAFGSLLGRAAQRRIDVAMIGGGAAGVELALALSCRLREQARVTIVTGGAPPLASHAPGVQRRARRALGRAGITVVEDRCTAVAADHVQLGGGQCLACDVPLLAIGGSAPPWLRGSGLALDDRGFVATGPTLQSTSHPHVFAAGDVASRSDAPHPKSGVYAVRAGPPLATNLRRFIDGGVLQFHAPQRRSLNLLACGERRAIGSWGRWSFEGEWVWRWKDHIDRAFIARYAAAQETNP